MIIKIKYPQNIHLEIDCNDIRQFAKKSVLIDNFFLDEYVLNNCDSFNIIVNTDVKPFNTSFFKKNWINGIKWSFVSVDWYTKRQSWKINLNDFGNNGKKCIDFNIEPTYIDNYYNGYVKKYKLCVKNQKNVKLCIRNTTHINLIDNLLMYSFIFLNQLPLILLIALFIYSDIVHPEWFKSGTFFIFLYDIPLLIILIINILIAVYKTKKIIVWVKNSI